MTIHAGINEREIVVADAAFSEVRHPLGHGSPRHRHTLAYFSMLLRGTYTEILDGGTIEYEPLTLVFHAARAEHADVVGSNGAHFFAIVLRPVWNDVIATLGTPRAPVAQLHGGVAAALLSQIYEEYSLFEAAGELTIESLLYELCAHVCDVPEEQNEPVWLPRADRLLQNGFAERISVARLASQLGVHPARLARAFRRYRGRTIGEVVLQSRMHFACKRLGAGNGSMTEIAHEAGFANLGQMTRVFRTYLGKAPNAYRTRRELASAASR